MALVRAQEDSSADTFGCRYHVFLSFRGEDTRKTFTDHIYTAFVDAGLQTFRDDDELERGEDIKPELEKAIQHSRSSVIVFSKDYASSKWCLDELVMILQRKRTSDHVVLPVFYDIDPSEVRKQTGSFAKAFAGHQKNGSLKKDKVNGWRAALAEVADLAGMVLQNECDGLYNLISPFIFIWIATGNKHYTQKHYTQTGASLGNKDLAIFFLEKDMRPGTTMKFQFPRNLNTATFLPRESAQSIPFSSKKLPEIFNHFSVKPTSEEAKTINQTIEECEAPGLKGEEIYCATSLESMVDFSTSKLGTRNVEAISTEVLEKGATMSMHNYTTMPGLKKLAGDKVVVCHKENYPYAVYFCHAIKQTAAYVLSLKGDDGEKVKAVTICHLDTSEWDPEHLSFQIVKPGTIPICHFIYTDAIAWVPNHK
ncbi:PREDICTED: BURP domain-containing protein 5-like [Prunus mume]|uniref:BURP domain-containing protein 5-like n=1 Tax=Prunus mume TaxID=102107 RepID=A0ABM1LYJ6_PRUMU|nr:PREDICTED: BURP domain-containing protein 5-like [Prunus mume]